MHKRISQFYQGVCPYIFLTVPPHVRVVLITVPLVLLFAHFSTPSHRLTAQGITFTCPCPPLTCKLSNLYLCSLTYLKIQTYTLIFFPRCSVFFYFCFTQFFLHFLFFCWLSFACYFLPMFSFSSYFFFLLREFICLFFTFFPDCYYYFLL